MEHMVLSPLDNEKEETRKDTKKKELSPVLKPQLKFSNKKSRSIIAKMCI